MPLKLCATTRNQAGLQSALSLAGTPVFPVSLFATFHLNLLYYFISGPSKDRPPVGPPTTGPDRNLPPARGSHCHTRRCPATEISLSLTSDITPYALTL